jgi:hypothetical protein
MNPKIMSVAEERTAAVARVYRNDEGGKLEVLLFQRTVG